MTKIDFDKSYAWLLLQGQTLEIPKEAKEWASYLPIIYANLYSELRDKDGRQQQAVTWGVSLLAGSGILGSNIGVVTKEMLISTPAILGILTITLGLIIYSLAEDRLSIARQLDRIHEVMRVFDDDCYYKGNSLFDPNWRGWGFSRMRDVNYRHSLFFIVLLILIFIMDVGLFVSIANTPLKT